MYMVYQIVFPKEPLIILEGPLAITQLVETTILNLINYPSLVATNAARMRLAAGEGKKLIEFGLRRAQGPDGGLSASKYAYLGGFDATANVMAGKLFNISVKGTHAHSFVMSYTNLEELQSRSLKCKDGCSPPSLDFVDLVLKCRKDLGFTSTNEGELTAFIAYAQSFPNGFLCLVDTYDTLNSGIKNFVSVSWALYQYGYTPVGIRLDSGDLAYLSKSIRELFRSIDTTYFNGNVIFSNCSIVASNDINEDVLIALNREGHEIDVFGVGTHLVTCQKQPALGCVYKLVEINGQPRIKLSQEIEKMVIPGRKRVYRLYGSDGHPLVDLMQGYTEDPPIADQKILVRHPFASNKRAYISPKIVVELLSLAFDGSRTENRGIIREKKELAFYRNYCLDQLHQIRHDHIRPLNPTPYKISVSQRLHDFLHDLWIKELPISELS